MKMHSIPCPVPLVLKGRHDDDDSPRLRAIRQLANAPLSGAFATNAPACQRTGRHCSSIRPGNPSRKERILAIDQAHMKRAASNGGGIGATGVLAHAHPSLDDGSAERQRIDKMLVEKAKHQFLERSDVVKQLSSMELYARCAAVRERQVLERAKDQAACEDRQREADADMERDRRIAVEVYKQREKQRAALLRGGQAVLQDQIHQRESERLVEQEKIEQEREAMLMQVKKLKKAEEEEARLRAATSRELLESTVVANREQVRAKEIARRVEAEEDARIQQYLLEKERREAAVEEERIKRQEDKEREVARLRAQQQSAIDEQAERDAVLARRAQASHERALRKKEKEAEENRLRINADLAAAREAQHRYKEKFKAQAIEHERQEFEKMIEKQEAIQKAENDAQEERRNVAIHHSIQLQTQIAQAHEMRRRKRAAQLAHGSEVVQTLMSVEAAEEKAKQAKLKRLRDSGVPEKFCAQLANFKIGRNIVS